MNFNDPTMEFRVISYRREEVGEFQLRSMNFPHYGILMRHVNKNSLNLSRLREGFILSNFITSAEHADTSVQESILTGFDVMKQEYANHSYMAQHAIPPIPEAKHRYNEYWHRIVDFEMNPLFNELISL